MIKLNKMKLTSVEMTTREFDTLNDLIQHGRHDVADNEFDARSNSGIWAYRYMSSLLSTAIMDVKTGNEKWVKTADEKWDDRTDNTMVTVTFLDLAIPAVIHLLGAISIEKNQEKIWTGIARNYWESDGHYEGKDKSTVISEYVKKRSFSSMELRGLIKKIENASNPKRTIKSVIIGAKND